MKYFLGIPIQNIPSKPSSLHISPSVSFDISDIISLLYFSYTNKHNIIFTPSHISSSPSSPSSNSIIYFILYGKKISISWKYFFIINHFFSHKYNHDIASFSIIYNIYYPFFFRIIYNHKLSISSQSFNLVGHQNSFFGIFDSYVGIVSNCKHLLFFSLSLNQFLLYKVFQQNNYIYGKLLPHFKINQGFLIYKYNPQKPIQIPSSMILLHQNIIGIKKNNIQFSVNKSTTLKSKQNYYFYNQFLQQFSIQNIYFINISYYINIQLLHTIHKFILSKFPVLSHSNNFVLQNPSNYSSINSFFSLYLFSTSSSNTIAIHISQYLYQYLPLIILTIDQFYSKILKNNKIYTSQIKIQYNPIDAIHLVSEFSYLVHNIIPYLYYISSNISLDKHDSQFTHINYSFTESEIHTIKSLSDKPFQFLKHLIIKTLSIFLDKYYLIIQHSSNIDIIPIYTDMSISNIQSFLNRSSKAYLSKTYLLSYLSELFSSLDKKYFELPLLFLNFGGSQISSNLSIQKIYGINHSSNIPIIINVFHNSNSLHISLSYRNKYKKLKYFFDEMIHSLLN